jgi:hypothetical protein
MAQRGISLGTRLARLEHRLKDSLHTNDALLDVYRADPGQLMIDAGFTPDPWQAELLRSSEQRILICAAR